MLISSRADRGPDLFGGRRMQFGAAAGECSCPSPRVNAGQHDLIKMTVPRAVLLSLARASSRVAIQEMSLSAGPPDVDGPPGCRILERPSSAEDDPVYHFG